MTRREGKLSWEARAEEVSFEEHTRGQPQYSSHTKNPLEARYPLLLVERGTVQVNILPKDVIPHETVSITRD